MTAPDSYDAPLSALRSHVEDLAARLAIWDARQEPDADARRCASDAVSAIDAMLANLHVIRARLVGETRQPVRTERWLLAEWRHLGPGPGSD